MTTLLALAAMALQSGSPLHGEALLDDVSHRAFNFFWKESPAPYYFTKDRAPNFPGKVPKEKTPASIAAIGYAMSAYAIGAHRHWVSKEEALERARVTVRNVLDKAPAYKGWYYHFFDPANGERMWNCEVSTIDTSLFINGLMMAEGYFKDKRLTALANEVYSRIDWTFMLTNNGKMPSEKFFTMGYTPEHDFINARWGDYNELMHLYIAAYALWDKMPVESWARWDRNPKEYKGFHFFRGGPLFLHQMSQGFYDFRDRRDRLGYDYWVGSRNATLAQRAYCAENPGHFKGYSESIWGLSACDNPQGYGGNGAPVDVNDNGTLAPVCATASVIFTPKESTEATEAFVAQYPESYGIYGFSTGINPNENWQSQDVIGIDIGQAMLNIENHRDGSPHRWMMSQPRVQRALAIIGLRKTSEGPSEKRPLRIEPAS